MAKLCPWLRLSGVLTLSSLPPIPIGLTLLPHLTPTLIFSLGCQGPHTQGITASKETP